MLQKIRCLSVVLMTVLALFAVSACEQKPSDQDRLMAFYEEIYGEGFVVRLPGQENRYAVLVPLSEDLYTGDQHIICWPLTTEGRFDGPEYLEKTGPYTLEVTKDSFRVGETVSIVMTNTGDDPSKPGRTSTGRQYYLDILVDGVWHNLGLNPMGEAGLVEVVLDADTSWTQEITSKSLNCQFRCALDEESGRYERYKDWERDVYLIPGHYRYGQSFDNSEGGYFIYCEFDVVE